MKPKAILSSVLTLLILITLPGCRSQLIFHPDKVIRKTPGDFNLHYETISFETADNVRLSGWWIPAENQIAVVLFFHGNGGNISHFLDPVAVWNRMGLSTFSVDYRGYGMSAGDPTEEGTYRDAEAAWKYLVRQRGIDPQNIIIYGKSLGGSVAAWLARDRTPGMLIVDSSFTRIAAVGRDLFPWAPAGLILGNAYPTEEYIRTVKCPVLIIHSRDDEMIPFHHGQDLYEAAPQPKEFLLISGSHNGGFYQSLPVYEPGLKSFTSKHVPSE
jgi:uncharacterized protein